MFIEIVKPQGKNIVTGVIYRPPNHDADEFLTMTNELLTKISKENKICYLMGDFNLNLMNHQSHSATGEFLDALYSNMFFPLIMRPTTITPHSATLIDNIFVNQGMDCFSLIFLTISLFFLFSSTPQCLPLTKLFLFVM